jgi:transcriptional regulator with XRE-family HTH domain
MTGATVERGSTPFDINARIANHLRALRTDRGLSLDALAERCGVSRSMLSLIERGESSPTAVILQRIAAGLNVSLATLFEDLGASACPLSHRADRIPWRDPESGYKRCNISPPNYSSPLQIVDITLPAGAHVAYEKGVGDSTLHQQVWLQEGSVEVTVGGVTYRLEKDDCLAMQLDEPIAFRNRTRHSARYIVVIANGRAQAAPRATR